MGIPRLTTYLAPYATTTVLGCDKPACPDRLSGTNVRSNEVIIDGPALAYFIYNGFVADNPNKYDVLAAVPSYDAVGKKVLSFLDSLVECSVIIKRIYFDGFLPPSKTEVRIARLQSQTNLLSTPIPPLHQRGNTIQAYEDSQMKTANSPKSKTTRMPSRTLPPAPFFVPAILEAIKESKYATVTQVVPGEADAYCAAAARQGGGTILTNDSDLLIHDLGPYGAVGSLNNLEFVDQHIADDFVTGRNSQYIQTSLTRPLNVAKSLGLQSLIPLAYVLLKDPYITFTQAIKQAQILNPDSLPEKAELHEYLIKPLTFEESTFPADLLLRIKTGTPFLDPRISELVLQSHRKSATIYLPVLIEDISRPSAFAASTAQRTFAYSSCPFPSTLPSRSIIEYIRKSEKVLPTHITTLSAAQILLHAQNLTKRLQQFLSTFSILPYPLIWRLYALAEVYHWYLDTSRSPPSRAEMSTLLTGKSPPKTSWTDIHLWAQIEASLYSLRITQQVLKFTLPSVPTTNLEHSVSVALIDLQMSLSDLPLLRHLMPSREELSRQTFCINISSLLDSLAEILQDDLREDAVYGVRDADGGKGRDGAETADTRKKEKKKRKKLKRVV